MVDFRVFVGSYERLLYGIDCAWNPIPESAAEVDEEEFNEPTLSCSLRVALPAHIGCIKALSCNSRHLCSGSTDETLKLYDIQRMKELGGVHSHSGTVTAIQYHGRYMISSSADGVILVHRIKDYELLKTLRGHKGAVMDMSVHPTGKVALSVGEDGMIKMWDLMKGRLTYSIYARSRKQESEMDSPEAPESTVSMREHREQMKLGKTLPERVQWDQQGTRYAVLFSDRIDITDLQNTNASLTMTASKHKQKFLDMAFATVDGEQQILIAACEDGRLRIYNLDDGFEEAERMNHVIQPVGTIIAHGTRIRAVQVIDTVGQFVVVTASSNGEIRIWSELAVMEAMQMDGGEETKGKPIGTYNTGSRLTCMTVQNLTGGVDGVADEEVSEAEQDDEEGSADEDGTEYESQESDFEEELTEIEEEDVSEPEEDLTPRKKRSKTSK